MRKINRLYKYTQVKFLQSCLDNGVYASKLDQLNDPYEKKGIVNVDDFRVVCMTNSYRKMLMWSYYTMHKGICIEYKLNDVVQPFINPVKYVPKAYNRRFLNIQEIKEDLGKKGKEWKHELEYRAIYHCSDNANVWNNITGTDDIFLKLSVSKVIAGCAISIDDLEQLINVVNRYNSNNNDNVVIERLILRDDRHELVKDPQFDAQAWNRNIG